MLKKFGWPILFSLLFGLVGCKGATEKKEDKAPDKLLKPPAGFPGGPKLKEGESPAKPLKKTPSQDN